MTRIEKQMIGVMFVLCGGIGAGIAYTKHAIKEAGGIKQIIIDTGKEIKEISKEINSDEEST